MVDKVVKVDESGGAKTLMLQEATEESGYTGLRECWLKKAFKVVVWLQRGVKEVPKVDKVAHMLKKWLRWLR